MSSAITTNVRKADLELARFRDSFGEFRYETANGGGSTYLRLQGMSQGDGFQIQKITLRVGGADRGQVFETISGPAMHLLGEIPTNISDEFKKAMKTAGIIA